MRKNKYIDRYLNRWMLLALVPGLAAGTFLAASCKPDSSGGGSPASIPDGQDPKCFSTGTPYPGESTGPVPGLPGIITERANMLLEVGPGLVLNTALLAKGGFLDTTYGVGVTDEEDGEIAGTQGSGQPVAFRYGGTLLIYQPQVAPLVGYLDPMHTDSSILFSASGVPQIRQDDGTFLVFDDNHKLARRCEDATCSTPAYETIARDPAGHILTVTDDSVPPRVINYIWDRADGLLGGKTDPAGDRITFDYTNGILSRTTLPDVNNDGNPPSTQYNLSSDRTKLDVVIPGGATYSFVLDANGGVTSFQPPNGDGFTTAWSADHMTLTFTNTYKNTWSVTNDGCHVVRTVDPSGGVHLFEWTLDGLPLAAKDPEDTSKDLFRISGYSPYKHPLSIAMEGLAKPYEFNYDNGSDDQLGRLSWTKDPDGVTTTFQQYADDSKPFWFNEPELVVMTGGAIAGTPYNETFKFTHLLDPGGNRIETAWDSLTNDLVTTRETAAGLPLDYTDKNNAKTTIQIGQDWSKLAIIDPNLGTTTLHYNANGDNDTQAGPSPNESLVFTLNKAGMVVATKDMGDGTEDDQSLTDGLLCKEDYESKSGGSHITPVVPLYEDKSNPLLVTSLKQNGVIVAAKMTTGPGGGI